MSSDNVGGGERGCRRTIALYRKLGVTIIQIEKPSLTRGIFNFIVDSIRTFFFFFLTLLRNPEVPIHLVGFYERQLYYEYLLFQLAKLFGRSIAYELRNGTFVKTYSHHSAIYRWLIKRMVRKADVVLCQGLEFVRFIKDKWGVESLYYPNYILEKDIKPYQERQHSPLSLVYFGRITKNKNVDVAIKVVDLLISKHVNVQLDIIGAYSESYKDYLDNYIEKMNIPQNIIAFHGAQSFDYIAEKLSRAHYYIFPSSEPKEGHSNSLTEAMAFGVVPIVSNAGFNATICGNTELVIDEINAELYAYKIMKIEKSGKWLDYSHSVYKRFCDNYTEYKALGKIKIVCNKLNPNLSYLSADN